MHVQLNFTKDKVNYLDARIKQMLGRIARNRNRTVRRAKRHQSTPVELEDDGRLESGEG
jgi:hypothetical protein